MFGNGVCLGIETVTAFNFLETLTSFREMNNKF